MSDESPRLELEIDEIKRGLLDLDARLHALEAKGPPRLASDLAPAISIITDLNARIHALEAKVTNLQMYSLGRPSAFSPPPKA